MDNSSSSFTNPSSIGMFWGKDSKGTGLHTYLPPSETVTKQKVQNLLKNSKNDGSKIAIVTKKAGPKLLEGYRNNANANTNNIATTLHDNDETPFIDNDDQGGNTIRSPLEQIANETLVVPSHDDNDDDDNPVQSSQIERVLTNDPITAALTAPSNPSENYFNVLKALIAAVRTTLVANTSALTNPQNYFKTPTNLQEAFPTKIREEDPDYFWLLEYNQKEDAYKNSSYAKGLQKAYAATGDNLVYAFDRRPIPTPSQIAAASGITEGKTNVKKENRNNGKAHTKTMVNPSSVAGNGIRAVRAAHQTSSSSSSSSSNDIHPSSSSSSSSASPHRMNPFTMLDPLSSSSSSSSVYVPDLANGPPELLGMQIRDHVFRSESSNVLLQRQGRTHTPNVTHLTGNVAISSGSGGTSGNPLPGDAVADSLRWSEQQRLEMEHRRARCEHVLHLLQREMATESERQIILRKSAAKYATSEARYRGLEWESYAVGINDPLPTVKGNGGSGWADRSGLSPTARRKGLKYKGNHDHALGGSNARTGGSGRFTMADLAQARYDAAKERAESADLLMRILEDYRLVPLSVAAGYLQQTLEEVDEMYAELIGARATEAGQSLTKEEIKEQMRELHQQADDELEAYENELYGLPTTKDKPKFLRSHHQPGTVVVPSSFYVNKGGAEPLPKHDDILEVKKFSAVHGGLSSYNVRPFTAREIARETLIENTVLPGLDDGYVDPRSKLASGSTNYRSQLMQQPSSHHPHLKESPYTGRAGFGSSSRVPSTTGGGKSKGGRSTAPMSMYPHGGSVSMGGDREDNDTEADTYERKPDGATRLPLQPVVPGNKDERDTVAGVGKLPPQPKKPSWLKNQTKNKTKKKTLPTTTSEAVLAEGPVPTMFKELDETLHAWQDNSRPSWQQQVLKSYDLTNLRESTANMYGIIQRTAKEPPDGRYSHLLGRYVSADVLRKQLADSRKLELAEKAKNRSPRA